MLDVKVATWNVLARAYAWTTSFPGCDLRSELEWEARSVHFAAILKQLDADILCLQEVDQPAFFAALLQELGYAHVYQRRPSGKEDGCMTAWKAAKFELTDSAVVDFDALAQDREGEGSLGGGGEHRFLRHNIALLAAFRRRQPPTGSDAIASGGDAVARKGSRDVTDDRDRFVVGNTHLYWNPEAADVKLTQARLFNNHTHAFARDVARRIQRPQPPPAAPSLPVIACGDFNSSPISDVFALLTRGVEPAEQVPQRAPHRRFRRRFVLPVSRCA